MTTELRIGTRGSPLALAQARLVAEALENRAPVHCRVVPIRTEGDQRPPTRPPRWGVKALFTGQIEADLSVGKVDVAVHSLKDLPSSSADTLLLAAVPEREDPRDVLVSAKYRRLAELPRGSRIGTSSLRRAAQLRAMGKEFQIEQLHGNVETRLRKLGENPWDGIVIAAAGLRRLGLGDRVTEVIAPEQMLPAPGQGALAVQVRKDDAKVLDWVTRLDHVASRQAVEAEREFAQRLEGDCNVPVAALAEIGDKLRLTGAVFSPDGTRSVRGQITGEPNEAASLGRRLADDLLRSGAATILEAARA